MPVDPIEPIINALADLEPATATAVADKLYFSPALVLTELLEAEALGLVTSTVCPQWGTDKWRLL
jgi:hypothetical protein